MIMHKDIYLDFMCRRGVGFKDLVASSPDSYISYLNSISRLIGSDSTSAVLRNKNRHKQYFPKD